MTARARLLVVDDNPGYRRLVRLALDGDPAFEVAAEVVGADDALAVAAEVRPDVARVDVLLPEGQGLRLPAALHAVVPGCVVVLTSAHPEGDIDAISQLGGLALLSKSVAPSRLGARLAALVIGGDHGAEALHQATVELPSSRESPREARRFVARILGDWDCEAQIDTVTLLVSELVGNAVLHTTSEIELSIRRVPGVLRVDVVDRSTLLPKRREAGESDETGRGSDLVELVAAAWGITGRPDGKSVWFEIAVPDPPGRAGTTPPPDRAGAR